MDRVYNTKIRTISLAVSIVSIALAVFGLITSCGDRNNNHTGIDTNKNIIAAVDVYKLTNQYNQNNLDQNTKNIVGRIYFSDSEYGLLIRPELLNITPGLHGFHIHNNPDCSSAMKDGVEVLGLAAGGHYDPDNTGKHLGPYNKEGHRGDLPFLYVDHNGIANVTLLAPKLKLSDLINKSVMIHEGGDNYSDTPKSLGGGGARMYCGIITEQSFQDSITSTICTQKDNKTPSICKTKRGD